jgi:hypothetical protein
MAGPELVERQKAQVCVVNGRNLIQFCTAKSSSRPAFTGAFAKGAVQNVEFCTSDEDFLFVQKTETACS